MVTERRPPTTAAALDRMLQADPYFVARQKARERALEQERNKNRLEEEALLTELRTVGFILNSVSDFVNFSDAREDAIPILLRHLLLPYSERLREFIARALATPNARFAWPVIANEYRKSPSVVGKTSMKDGLAVALSAMATEDTIPELLQLVRDPLHGRVSFPKR